MQKNGKETVVTVFFPFFTIISFSNFTQLLVFHTYKSDIAFALQLVSGSFYLQQTKHPLTQRLIPYAPDAVDCLSAFRKITILPYVL